MNIHIHSLEAGILLRAVGRQVIQAADITEYFPGKDKAIISRQIRKLIEQKMWLPDQTGGRKYVIRFDNNFLLRGIIKSLGEKGFLPLKD